MYYTANGMKVNLVNYEATFSKGILSKFAWKMSEELDAMGIRNAVTDRPDAKFDINHHIMYMAYKHADSVNTLMVTHVDTAAKIARLRECMNTADLGICFSQETVDNLAKEGFPSGKLTYVLPAHDERLLPIPVSILTNVYPDGCKREGMLFELAKRIEHADSVNTLMVTHVDTAAKIARLRECMNTADLGICFSQETVDNLAKEGFPSGKLTYVLPAHDERLLPIPVSILTNVYPDGCKREGMLFELAKRIDKERFVFKIMGSGWDADLLAGSGINFELHPKFDRAVQDAFLRDSKYYLYFGVDEGSMALLDAKNAGVRTIAPLDGFHIHAGVDLPFASQEDLNAIFLRLQEPPLKEWTWKNHAREHVRIWERLLAGKTA